MKSVSIRLRISVQRRAGFTLVEILISIVIAGIIAGMLSAALSGANRQAKEIRGRTMVERLNLIMLQIYETEAERNVRAPTSTLQLTTAPPPNPNSQASKSRALATLNWKRDYLRCSLPDRILDLTDIPIEVYYQIYIDDGGTLAITRMDPNAPGMWNDSGPTNTDGVYRQSSRWASQIRYQQRVYQLVLASDPAIAPANFRDCVDGNANNGEWTTEFQSAECLYLILATQVINGTPASDSLHERDIGDLDEDGVPEVLDPWGVPFGFLRWPCGNQLPLVWEPGEDPPVPPTQPSPSELAARKIELGKDPLDILYADPRYDDRVSANYQRDDPFPLTPMIVSAGQDGVFDLVGLDAPPYDAPTATQLQYFPDDPNDSLPIPNIYLLVDPFQYWNPQGGGSVRLVGDKPGAIADQEDPSAPGFEEDNAADNIYPSYN